MITSTLSLIPVEIDIEIRVKPWGVGAILSFDFKHHSRANEYISIVVLHSK